jgi:hypothetical protein
MAALGAGCGSSGGTGGTGGAGGTGGTVDLCAAAGGSGQVSITGEEITQNTRLTANCNYILTQKTYVVGATLTIDPGVTIGGGRGSALIITTSGMIDAQGTVDAPIVMTSSRGAGQRVTGDWGGVVLLGNAKLSWGNAVCDGVAGDCVANIEGLPDTETRGRFGGDDDTHNCGTLRYVRIEFAGDIVGLDNELNGLTVGGCGDQTVLDYIQIHRGLDDGVEFFGGKPNIKHVIVTGAGDDGLDWDQGFRGTVENFIVHHFAGSSSDPRGIEADNYSQNNDVEPRSAPMVRNGTVVATGTSNQQGIVLRRGTFGQLDGLVVANWTRAGFDMRDASWEATGGWPMGVVVTNSCFDANNPNWPPWGTNCEAFLEADRMGDCNDPGAPDMQVGIPANMTFDESTAMADGLGNLEEDPGLGDFSGATDGTSTPDYSVGNANCMGAFATAGADNGTDWTVGWTAFPAD